VGGGRKETSLARLLASQARCDEERTMLAEIYGWFIERFDTADSKEAKALLDELSASSFKPSFASSADSRRTRPSRSSVRVAQQKVATFPLL
jgi:hypothetical protein